MINNHILKVLEEGRNQDLARQKLEKGGKPQDYEMVSVLDKTPTQKHLPKLVDYYLEGYTVEVIKSYYERFLKSPLRDKDINVYKKFKDFETAIDAVPEKIDKTKLDNIDDAPIYEDTNIKVWKGDEPYKCIKYGEGYTFCISKKGTGNMYFSYRSRGGFIFYFVRVKNRPITDNKHMVVIGVSEYGLNRTFADNGLHGGYTSNTDKNTLIREVPELKVLFDKNLLIPKPLTSAEKKEIDQITSKKTDKEFSKLPYETKVKYIKYGHKLSDIQWDTLDDTLKNEAINFLSDDLSSHQKESIKDTKLIQAYQKYIKKSFEIKNKQEEYGRDSFTSDEITYAKTLGLKYNGRFVEEASKSWQNTKKKQNAMFETIKSRIVPEDNTIIGSINISNMLLDELPAWMKSLTVKGSFYCDNNQLTSLEGCPQTVEGHFYCYRNQLTSLEGGPQTVKGDFYCYKNQLTSLEGCPQTVEGDFYCDNNQLTSLEGCPQTVEGSFYCDNNQLTSLEGGPQTVKGGFSCNRNQLTSLEGGPQTVKGGFSCNNNQLTSLEGGPQTVKGYFSCNNNQLTSLEGGPQTVKGHFSCDNNQLTSLEGGPQTVEGDFYCNNNQLTSLEGGPQTVEGSFYCNNNQVSFNYRDIVDAMERSKSRNAATLKVRGEPDSMHHNENHNISRINIKRLIQEAIR
jgi:hypothetical protein